MGNFVQVARRVGLKVAEGEAEDTTTRMAHATRRGKAGSLSSHFHHTTTTRHQQVPETTAPQLEGHTFIARRDSAHKSHNHIIIL
jgi:hypothetical protein